MSTSILIPTVEDAFAVGRVQGLKEAFTEIEEMSRIEDIKVLRVYLAARLKSLNDTTINNPFKQKD